MDGLFCGRTARCLRLGFFSFALVAITTSCHHRSGSEDADVGESCGDQQDCVAGAVCYQGICRAQCSAESDCVDGGDACVDGVCLALVSSECTSDTDCVEPDVCHGADGAQCVAGSCTYPVLEDGSACALGVCADGACVGCIEDDDCGAPPGAAVCFSATCQSHSCVYVGSPATAQCADAYCSDGTYYPAAQCGDANDCAATAGESCDGYTCNNPGTLCRTSCGDDFDCTVGQCQDGICCEGDTCCLSDDPCGDYLCDTATRSCRVSCADTSECAEGLYCDVETGLCGAWPLGSGCASDADCADALCSPEGYCRGPFVIDSGVPNCYDGASEMSCSGLGGDASCGGIAYCGQDADYTSSVPREYSTVDIAGDVVVRDQRTALIWVRDEPAPLDTRADAVAYCDALDFAGETDWRLPSIEELMTLSYFGANNPALDPAVFPRSAAAGYWSATDTGAATKAPGMAIDGQVKSFALDATGGTMTARCVRGGVPLHLSERYVVLGTDPEQWVEDVATGLVSQLGITPTLTMQEALSHCESLDYAGFDDWRLPNIVELQTLADQSFSPAANGFPYDPSDQTLWSSTTNIGQPNYGWLLYLKDGYVPTYAKVATHSVRCVR